MGGPGLVHSFPPVPPGRLRVPGAMPVPSSGGGSEGPERAAHRPTGNRSIEPILIPKLRNRLAEFPYVLCGLWPRDCSSWRPDAESVRASRRDTIQWLALRAGVSRAESKGEHTRYSQVL